MNVDEFPSPLTDVETDDFRDDVDELEETLAAELIEAGVIDDWW